MLEVCLPGGVSRPAVLPAPVLLPPASFDVQTGFGHLLKKTEFRSRKNGIHFPEKRNWLLLTRRKCDIIFAK